MKFEDIKMDDFIEEYHKQRKEAILAEMKELFRRNEEGNNYCIESGHARADDLLIAMLEEEGHSQIVELYKKLPKWFS